MSCPRNGTGSLSIDRSKGPSRNVCFGLESLGVLVVVVAPDRRWAKEAGAINIAIVTAPRSRRRFRPDDRRMVKTTPFKLRSSLPQNMRQHIPPPGQDRIKRGVMTLRADLRGRC